MDPEKLNWMYAGPAGHVNPDEYLTGRAVDKTFEQFKLGGAEPIGLDLPPPTLPRNSKSSVPGFQVDVARKVQEDPLLRIKLKAEERKAELMEQMLIKRRLAVQSQKKSKQHEEETQTAKKGKEKKKKKKKKKKKRDSDSEDSESSDSDLDAKLARKMIYLKQEKEDLDTQIANKLKKLKGQKKRSSSSSSSSSSASVSSSSESDNTKSSVPKKRYRSISPKKADEGATAKRYSDRSPRDRDKHRYDREPMDYRRPRNDRRRSRSPHQKEWRKRPYEDRDRNRDRDRDRDRDKGRERERARDVEKERDKRRSSPEQSRPQERTGRPGPPAFQRRPAAPKLSEEELEKRRREMMQDAVVRDNERKDRVEQYKKEAAAEDDQLNDNRPKEAAFVRNQLARAASSSTVESRIKSNVFNIQRSGASMDSNFARR